MINRFGKTVSHTGNANDALDTAVRSVCVEIANKCWVSEHPTLFKTKYACNIRWANDRWANVRWANVRWAKVLNVSSQTSCVLICFVLSSLGFFVITSLLICLLTNGTSHHPLSVLWCRAPTCFSVHFRITSTDWLHIYLLLLLLLLLL